MTTTNSENPTRYFSLREHLSAQGVANEADLQKHLKHAYNILSVAPKLDPRRFKAYTNLG